MKHKSSSTAALLSLLLIVSFVLAPVTQVLAQSESISTSLEGDGDGDSDADAADAAAGEVSAAADAAGISVSVDSVYGADPSGSEVSVNGVSISTDSALNAIAAISVANSISGNNFVDNDQTFAAHAKGLCDDCVVGQLSGQTGTPEDVAQAEIKAQVDSNTINGIISGSFDAIKDSQRSSLETALAQREGVTSVAAGSNNLSEFLGNFYDENKNAVITNENGDTVGVNKDGVLAITVKAGPVDVANTATEASETIYSADVFFSPELVSSEANQDTQFGPGTANKFTQVTPAQRQMLGENVTGDDWNDPSIKANAGAILAAENSELAGKIGRGESLTPEQQAEANSIMSVAINRAASRGVSVTNYFTNNIYSNWQTASQDRIQELESDPRYDQDRVGQYYADLFNGNTLTRSLNASDLQSASPIGAATHYYNPAVATDQQQGRFAVDGTVTSLGEHVFSQQYYGDRSGIEYAMKTTGLPDYISVLNATPADIQEVISKTSSGVYTDWLSSLHENVPVTNVASEARTMFNREDYLDYKAEVTDQLVRNDELPSVTGGKINYEYKNNTARDLEIQTPLQSQLQYAGKRVGVDVHIVSGGQISVAEAEEMGAKKASDGYWYVGNERVRTGSNRHDHGGAADLYVTYVDGERAGEVLDMNNPDDKQVMGEFLAEAVTAGANGIGAGQDYMGSRVMHVGGGTALAWGAEGRVANAPDWVSASSEKGLAARNGFDISQLENPQPTNTTQSPQTTQTAQTSQPTPSPAPQLPTAEETGEEVGIIAGNSICGSLCGAIGGLAGKTLGELISNGFEIDKRSGNGNNNLNYNEDTWQNSSNDGGSNNNDCTPCPLSTGCSELVYLGYCECIQCDSEEGCENSNNKNYCPVYNTDNTQLPTAFLGLVNAYPKLHIAFKRTLAWYLSLNNNHTDQNYFEGIATEPVIVPVTVTINASNGLVELGREDILIEFIENADQYTSKELIDLFDLFEETPLVFADDGNILYSNGLYSPEVEEGMLVETGEVKYSYVYTVRFVDEDGKIIKTADTASVLPENAVTRILKSAFTNNSSFGLNSVKNVSYSKVDPRQEIAGDEYYAYKLTLNNDDERSTTVPQFSSVNYMQERFGEIGYRGDVLALVAQANEIDQLHQTATGKFLGFVENLYTGLVSRMFTDTTSDIPTDLPNLGEQNSLKILSLSIYNNTDIKCANDDVGFVYAALVANRENPYETYYITDGRCGESAVVASMAAESIDHLSDKYAIDENVEAGVLDNIVTSNQLTHNEPLVSRINLEPTEIIPDEISNTPTETNDTNSSSTPTETQLPNTTNQIVFEVKAVGDTGEVLVDWTEAEKVTISEGVQLSFRWDATEYQQCLLFLNDNGNYSLTVQNRAMTSGNTEVEQYNLTERSAKYSIECGGQRNGEAEVDTRAVEVTVE